MRHIGTHNRVCFCWIPSAFIYVACVFLGTSLSALPLRADEFSTIPATDPIYQHLTVLRQSQLSSDKGGPVVKLTRYEVAIETARAILKITTGQPTLSGSRSSLRALRKLTEALRPELTRLDINVNDTLRLLNDLINNGASETNVSTSDPISGASLTPSENISGTKFKLSQRLRVYSAVSSLARDADDPFGDTANFAVRNTASVARRGTLGAAANGSEAVSNALPKESLVGGVEVGAALALTDWMQVRANFGQDQITPGSVNGDFRLRAPLLDGAHEARSVGTGVDVALLHGVNISGDVARITALNADGAARAGTRFGGVLNLSAWQNRLSLSANISRLVPEDADILPSTGAEFNLGADVTRRLSLNLRYQQMFAAQGNNRLVSGGISVKF